jgi:ABC-type nitrate/sulfonate/bicarbonate transport system substrate-binding protein
LKIAGTTGLAAAGGQLLQPGASFGQGKGKARLAYLQLGWAATEIIHKEDLLGKRGWQTEYTPVGGSPSGLVNTFAAKNVDAIDMSFILVAKMFEDGVPIKVTGTATALLGAIVSHKDAGIKGVEDLKGRKVTSIVGTSTFFDIRTLILKGYGFDVQKEAQIVTAASPPDMANLLAKRDVDAMIAWQPISDLAVHKGFGVYTAKQIDLWRKATGRQGDYPVHVCYGVNTDFIKAHPTFPKDLNDAQKDAVDIWYNRKARALEIVAEITKLPKDVLEVAYKETVRMLHGLDDAQVETLLVQLKLVKEAGFLKSDIWNDTERVKREFFWKA